MNGIGSFVSGMRRGAISRSAATSSKDNHVSLLSETTGNHSETIQTPTPTAAPPERPCALESKTGLDADALANAADDDGAESEEDPGYFEQGYYDDDSAEAGEDGQQPVKSPEPEALVETMVAEARPTSKH